MDKEVVIESGLSLPRLEFFDQKIRETEKLAEQRFEKMISEVEDYAIILLGVDGTIVSWNKGAEKIKGYKREEIIGRSFRLFYTKEDKENGLPDKLLTTALTNGRVTHEGWRIRKDGSRFWGNVTLTAMHDEEDNVSGILKVTRDLTERKKTEEKHSNYVEQLRFRNDELRESEERYHKMVSEVSDYAIILLDRTGIVLDWNKGAEKLKGYSQEEIIGKSFRLFYPMEDKEAKVPEQFLFEARENGSAIREGWRIKKDGSRFWGSVTLTSLHGANGDIIGFSKVTKDLTEKKTAEDQLSNFTEELKLQNKALKEGEERYHRMIAEVQDYAIILLSKDGIVQNWNTGAALLKGYSAQEIIGKSFETFYLREDVEKGVPRKLLEEARLRGRATSEGWRVKKDGTKFWGSIVITALHSDSGEIIGYSKVTRDLTERKEAEDQLKLYAQQLEQKNMVLENLNSELASFSYIVSHDLKEPIRKIRIFSERQQEAGKSVDQILEYSKKIEGSAERMQKLMDDLLLFAELSNEKPFEKIDLNEILQSVKTDLEIPIAEKDAIIHSSKLPIINGVQHQLQQLFLNLLSNSLKFSKKNERLEMKVTSRKVDGEQVIRDSVLNAETYYEICFVDNGIGFSPEHSKKIFEVFQRLQPKHESTGSGVGLAIVKKVMLNHAGFVISESEPGKGATFKLYFPVSED